MEDYVAEPDLVTETTRLLVSVVLDDATDVQIARLNDLLERDVALREHASRFLAEEAILRHEFQVLSHVGEFHGSTTSLAPGAHARVMAVSCRTPRFAWARRAGQFFLAASLMSAVFVAIRLNGRDASEVRKQTGLIANPDRGRYQSAAILPPVTSVSWSGPTFGQRSETPLATPLHEGVADFTSVKGRRAQGYMVQVPAGALLDLVVAADACGENALAVSEFDCDGQPTGRRFSFSNSTTELTTPSHDPQEASGFTKYGPLGVWTERNNTSSPRFYLFTSVHKLVDKSTDDAWHISRLSVMLDDADLVHIGWDDSGILRSSDREHVPDEDFDDLSATIRIRESADVTAEGSSGLRIFSSIQAAEIDTTESAEAIDDVTEGYQFAVHPGEVVVLRVVSRARAPVSIAVVERDSGETRWSRRHVSTRSGSLGVCALENGSSATRHFRLIGRHAEGGAANQSWLASNHSVLSRQDTFATVGFEDGHGESEFNYVKVDVLTMSAL